jgi:excisionase family DNA binding protein
VSPRAVATPERMLTVGEAADLLGVDRSQVYHWIRSGRLPSLQYPGRTGSDRGPRRIRQSAVDKFLADCERA